MDMDKCIGVMEEYTKVNGLTTSQWVKVKFLLFSIIIQRIERTKE